jgi:hypothetical protein
MRLQDRLEYLRSEQQELFHLAQQIEEVLELAQKEGFSDRSAALSALRTLEHRMLGIVEHCHSEDRAVESTFHHYLDSSAYKRVITEHEQLLKVLHNFHEELRFATGDSTATLIPSGRDLITQLRAHIQYEEALLNQIEQLEMSMQRPDFVANVGKS